MKNLALFSLVICFSCAPSQEIGLENGLVIKNATVISPENNIPKQDTYVITNGDTIVYIGKNKPHLTGQYNTIDAKGKYLIPGLIDSHVHITSTDGLSNNEELKNPEIVTQFREQVPKSYLYFGYTTLIDLGTEKPERLDKFKNADLKPDLYYVGGGAVIGNGYGLTNWNDETPNFIYKESDAYPIPEQYKKENHTPEAVVKRIAESGAIAVKTYYEPGFDPTKARFPVPDNELMEQLTTATHKHNLALAVHGNSIEAHSFLSKTKVDIVAHGLWNWENHRLTSKNKIPDTITSILNLEIKNNIGYMPTLQVINGLNTLTDAGFLDNPELKHVLPRCLIDYYKAHSDAMYQSVFGGAPKAIIKTNFNRISKQGKASLKYMNDHKGRILFGTDTPSSPTYGNPPGYNGYLEMLEMNQAGIPLHTILSAATIDNAKAFNLDNRYGSIEKGKKAHLLLLQKNPLQDITAYNSISKVIIGGHVIDRKALSAIQNDTKNE